MPSGPSGFVSTSFMAFALPCPRRGACLCPRRSGRPSSGTRVDEIVFHQRPRQLPAAEDKDVLAVLLLELGDTFGDVPFDGGRVAQALQPNVRELLVPEGSFVSEKATSRRLMNTGPRHITLKRPTLRS
jgi:hypothetical protein